VQLASKPEGYLQKRIYPEQIRSSETSSAHYATYSHIHTFISLNGIHLQVFTSLLSQRTVGVSVIDHSYRYYCPGNINVKRIGNLVRKGVSNGSFKSCVFGIEYSGDRVNEILQGAS
jgi:hypothetical protein